MWKIALLLGRLVHSPSASVLQQGHIGVSDCWPRFSIFYFLSPVFPPAECPLCSGLGCLMYPGAQGVVAEGRVIAGVSEPCSGFLSTFGDAELCPCCPRGGTPACAGLNCDFAFSFTTRGPVTDTQLAAHLSLPCVLPFPVFSCFLL